MSDLDEALALLAGLPEAERAAALRVLRNYAGRSPHGGPFTWLLGVQYDEVRPGFTRCHLDVGRHLHNPAAIAHGAVAYALIDSAMGAAFYNALERPLGCATIELKVNYLRPVVAGRVWATAELVEQTRRFGLLTGRVTDEQDRLVALGQGTFAIIKPA
ncbi:MAG TPA: PaaI family thioesterase [Herpetosiphonaceae bacterium]